MSDDINTTTEENTDDTASEEAVEESHQEEETSVDETYDVQESTKPQVSVMDFNVGDTVKVHYKIIEGDKQRVQPYEGIVIAKKGTGVSKTFTVRRIGFGGIGVERIFPIFSPNIVKVDVLKHGKVRRAKLYYIRGRKGKAATKIKERKVTA